jgi:hypothetical protein
MKIAVDMSLKLIKVRHRASLESINIFFVRGYSSIQEQQALHDCWLDPICREQRKIVYEPAKPGKSAHNYAEAVDWYCLPVYAYHRCNQIAKEEGLYLGLLFNDPYHWDNAYAYGAAENMLATREVAIANMAKDFTESKLVDI